MYHVVGMAGCTGLTTSEDTFLSDVHVGTFGSLSSKVSVLILVVMHVEVMLLMSIIMNTSLIDNLIQVIL